ncbi:MAG: fused MFS/spermidine synthase [Paludisphaera borealis]|uniref:fused MFS/spermidine synthase n=1 Tax=Paludisphaera borealis TaxID=1387353 RepID=UPI00284CCD29|nr:fused MFS/spermidine synthase [Paludisphaera borealis]MDR3620848.1 fused MFS/spermidine synthase [Paludisphaera borealis]
MVGLAARLSPYALAFFSSLCIMILELVSSRLVAQHVGSSLTVWTSVIGIILGGICLGNVLGGRLADRVEPRQAVGPLFATGAFLTLSALWVNSQIAHIIPSPDVLNWELRTVIVVTLDFLLPATVLGMIGPVVAKMAVEQSQRAGSAIGDVYFCGAVGSIAGTFLAGFVLISLAPTSVIVLVVAAALALMAATLSTGAPGKALGGLTGLLLGLGAIAPLIRMLGVGGIDLGGYHLNYVAVLGNLTAVGLAIVAVGSLWSSSRAAEAVTAMGADHHDQAAVRPSLKDLAALAFLASLGFMAMEMVAGRLVTRHLGSSVYGWTSVIGVLLAGLSVGNYLGGRVANHIRSEKQASWLFMIASIFTLAILFLDNMPHWFREWLDLGIRPSLLSRAISLTEIDLGGTSISLTWQYRVLFVVVAVFFLPSVSMGTVSPVVAKLAVDRLKRFKRTGTAIGEVYAWGMVGSILGTFLTGFYLIDVLGTKGVLLVLAAVLALAATILGTVWHAVWAGIPLGLCVIAFLPAAWTEKIGQEWSIREERGDPTTKEDALAWIDESNYYYIKVDNEPQENGKLQLRTLVLDNLIHGYFILGHPERLDYDYEHIYALVAYRAAQASGKITVAPSTASTPASSVVRSTLPDNVFATDAPADGKANPKTETKPAPVADAKSDLDDEISAEESRSWYPKVEKSTLQTLFLGGGAYTFQRHMQHIYPGTEVDVAEIDPAVTRANFMATGLDPNTTIKTIWGDARQFVERNQDKKQYDIIFGDAFNDFSVPWHLTTREFNDKIAKMMSPTGVYMINIIDAYETDEEAIRKADKQIAKIEAGDRVIDEDSKEVKVVAGRGVEPAEKERIREDFLAKAHRYGSFLGSWTATAKLTFPHVYIFGTNREIGSGARETFVVVASKQPLDLTELGRRVGDPRFYHKHRRTEPIPYGPKDEETVLKSRSRGIILTDDYAPVENLLAPVAETRGND